MRCTLYTAHNSLVDVMTWNSINIGYSAHTTTVRIAITLRHTLACRYVHYTIMPNANIELFECVCTLQYAFVIVCIRMLE